MIRDPRIPEISHKLLNGTLAIQGVIRRIQVKQYEKTLTDKGLTLLLDEIFGRTVRLERMFKKVLREVRTNEYKENNT